MIIILALTVGGCGSEPAPPPAEPAPTAASPPGAGELPGGLPHGERTLTGVVEQSTECVLLRVGDHRWQLTGTPADALTGGTTVTVTGQVTTPNGCADEHVTRALIVRSATPR